MHKEVRRPLEFPQVVHKFFHNKRAPKRPKLILYFKSLLNASCPVLVDDFGAARAPVLFVPFVADHMKPLEINGSPAHGATRASPLEIPLLDAVGAKLVPTAELATRARLRVANGTLHFFGLTPAGALLACTQHKVLSHPLDKMATIAPPITPRPHLPTAQTSRKYYTLHSGGNNAFSLKLNDNVRTAIVGFKDVEDAVRIGSMIETHFINYREWPSTHEPGKLILPTPHVSHLAHIFIRVWAFDDLKFECTNNFLDLISVDSINSKTSSYSLNGDFFTFTADDDFYKNRIRELYELV